MPDKPGLKARVVLVRIGYLWTGDVGRTSSAVNAKALLVSAKQVAGIGLWWCQSTNSEPASQIDLSLSST